MQIIKFDLNEYFPNIGGEVGTTYVECYINPPRKTYNATAAPYPCMLICPGGGYGGVSPREGAPISLNFVSEGYQVFVLRYSVKPHCFPQQLREVAAAMEIISDHAEEWECDINNVSIMGFSAGGHLAAQYSNRYNCPEVRELFPDSKPVHRSILCYPVITADPNYRHNGSITHFVGHETTDPFEKGCGCEHLVTENTPPTFLWHTAEDTCVPVENSLIYAKALRDHKVPFELHIYPYGYHGLATVDTFTNPELDEKIARAHAWLDDCKKWLKLN